MELDKETFIILSKNLKPAEIVIYGVLFFSKKALSVKDIVEETGMSRKTVWGHLRNLKTKEYILTLDNNKKEPYYLARVNLIERE